MLRMWVGPQCLLSESYRPTYGTLTVMWCCQISTWWIRTTLLNVLSQHTSIFSQRKGNRGKGRTIRYLEGGLEFLLLANFFFTSERKKSSFFCDQRLTIFFLCFVEEFFCRMLSILCTLPFGVFSGQHIFHQFRQQTFFFCPHFQRLIFLTFVATNYFYQFFYLSNGASLKQ